jgi:ABC-type multidrug transport system fused ATPase/permease subunit
MRERALWRVGPYLRPHRVKIVFIAISALTSIACQLTIPLIAAAAIDGPIQDGDKAGLIPLFALAVVLAIIEISLTYRRRRNLAFVATERACATTCTRSSSDSRSASTTGGNRASCSRAPVPTSQ